jgi:hypothetical protein
VALHHLEAGTDVTGQASQLRLRDARDKRLRPLAILLRNSCVEFPRRDNAKDCAGRLHVH